MMNRIQKLKAKASSQKAKQMPQEQEEAGLPSRPLVKILPDSSEDNMGNVLFPLDREEANVTLSLDSLFESRDVRVFSDVNSCNPVLELSKISDQRLQVGDLHIGDDEEIEVLLSMNKGDQILDI